jgi:hypothetical protein
MDLKIIEKIRERGLFPTITRYRYMPYNMNEALQAVEHIGKSRNPRFVIDDENRFVFENVIRWVHGDPEMKSIDPETKTVVAGRLNAGIYIGGRTGTGKSWALEIMSAYCLIDNVQVKAGETQRCLHWVNVRTDTICDEYTTNGTVDRYKQMSIASIQDLGAEPAESLYMGNRVNVLRQILEYRGDFSDKITMITSNLPVNHKVFIDRYGERVESRLIEMCNFFEMKGRDRRKM